MGHLADVTWRGNAAEADSKAEHKSTGQKLVGGGGWSLHTGADNDDQSADKHAPSATKPVVDRASEKDGSDGSNIVHGKDEPGARACCAPVIESQSTVQDETQLCQKTGLAS